MRFSPGARRIALVAVAILGMLVALERCLRLAALSGKHP